MARRRKFEYNLGDRVTLVESGETGTVTARAEYLSGAPHQYSVRYKAGDGRQVEAWWIVDDIRAAS